MNCFTLLSTQYTYEEIKNRICVRMLNYEHYRKELENLAHIQWEDLAITFFYVGEEGKEEDHPMPVFREDLTAWGLDCYGLLRQALLESRRLHPPILRPMREILQLEDFLPQEAVPLYVLTCKEAGYGAATMLYPGLMAEIAERLKGDLYVIPSSVHELILMQADQLWEPGELLSVIMEVNRTAVLPGDFLANSLYLFRRECGEMERFGGISSLQFCR